MSKPKTLDELFQEVEAEAAAIPRPAPLTPEQHAKREADRLREDIRKGLRDANGDWIEPETDEDDENEDEDQ